MARPKQLVSLTLPVVLLLAGLGGPAAADGDMLIVPDQYATIQDAVDAAGPGATVMVRAGVYPEAVFVGEEKEGLTIAGAGMGATVLDGEGERTRGIHVQADRVTVRDLTIRDFQYSGTFFEAVDGFTMERLEAVDNGVYGLFAVRSQHGVLRDSVGRGHGDAAFYVGESPYCFCLVEGNLGHGNAQGYSGTQSNFITIRGNEFTDNRMGMSLSTLPSEPGLQQHATVVGNRIHHNNNPFPQGPLAGLFYFPVGVGIALAGGSHNVLADNDVHDNELLGIAMFWLTAPPLENRVVDNRVLDNGVDLWWDEWGVNNCWDGNAFRSADPPTLPSCAAPGVAGIHNVGVPDPRKDAWLVMLTVLQEGRPGSPYQTPLGPVGPLPLPS